MLSIPRPLDHLEAMRFEGKETVHAGWLRVDPDLYVPWCGAGRRKQTTPIETVSVKVGKACDERVTCANCQYWHADQVARIHAAQDVAKALAEEEQRAAVGITRWLPQLLESLAASVFGVGYEGAERLSCAEADIFAAVLLAGGQREAAQRVILAHTSYGQERAGMRHHVLDGTVRGLRLFAERYTARLLLRHCEGYTPTFPRAPEETEPVDRVYTVDLYRTTDKNGGPDWPLYVVPAGTALQAGHRALQEALRVWDPRPAPGARPAYAVHAAREGLPGPHAGRWTDLRNCSW